MVALRPALQVLTVVLALAATAYLWTSPVFTEHANGETVRHTIWADTGDWVPIVAVSLAFLFVISLGSWASAQLGKRRSTRWRLAMILAVVAAVAGVGITGFSVGLLYLPATILLVVLLIHSLALPYNANTATNFH